MKKIVLLVLLILLFAIPTSAGPPMYAGAGQALDPTSSPAFVNVTATGAVNAATGNIGAGNFTSISATNATIGALNGTSIAMTGGINAASAGIGALNVTTVSGGGNFTVKDVIASGAFNGASSNIGAGNFTSINAANVTIGTSLYSTPATVIAATNTTLTETQVMGTVINNYGAASNLIYTLPVGSANMSSFLFVAGSTYADFQRFLSQAPNKIYLDGVAGANAGYVQVPTVAVDNKITCFTFQTGAAVWDWTCSTVSGAWVAGP